MECKHSRGIIRKQIGVFIFRDVPADISGNVTEYEYADLLPDDPTRMFTLHGLLTLDGRWCLVPSMNFRKYADPTKETRYLKMPDGTERAIVRNLYYTTGADQIA